MTKVSSYIITEPYGDVEQDDFLNGCLEIETIYSPQDLLQKTLSTIIQTGCRRGILIIGPTLDIDIIYDRK
ncbi:MAG: 2-amino-4-hydroxy-6-hydroxymethyldihydropteridine diphosphokinase [Coprococcus sp.]